MIYRYLPSGFVAVEDHTGNIMPGRWWSVVSGDQSALRNMQRVGSTNYSQDAKVIRESFKDFFIISVGSLSLSIQASLSIQVCQKVWRSNAMNGSKNYIIYFITNKKYKCTLSNLEIVEFKSR